MLRKIVIIASLLAAMSSTAWADEPTSLSNKVTDQAVSFSLEPYQDLKEKLKHMNSKEKKVFLSQLKAKWDASSDKADLKRQLRAHLKKEKARDRQET